MSDLFLSAGLAGDIERLQRQVASLFDGFPTSIRAAGSGTFPRINIGSTDDSIEIVAFAPGVDPAKLDVSIDKRLLTISGERNRAAGRDEGAVECESPRWQSVYRGRGDGADTGRAASAARGHSRTAF